MTTSLSRGETSTLCVLTVACLAIVGNTFHGDGEPLLASLGLSGMALSLAYCLIRWLGNAFIAAGLKGRDMSKLRKVEM